MWKDERTDRQTDMTKLIVAFRNFAKASKYPWSILRLLTHYSPLSCHLQATQGLHEAFLNKQLLADILPISRQTPLCVCLQNTMQSLENRGTPDALLE